MSVLFTGYYGQLNTGDDAFCLISDWAAKKYWNEHDTLFHGRNLPFKQNGETLKSTLFSRKFFKRQEIIETYYQSLLSKNIIYSGGSIFHSDVKGYSNKSNVFYKFQKVRRTKLGAVGVSLGPYRSSTARESIKEYLKHFSFIALRDKKSYEDALDMNLSIPVIESFDMAALMPLMYPLNKKKNEVTEIGVSFCDYEKYRKDGNVRRDDIRFDKLVETIKLLSKNVSSLKINILVFNNHPVVGDLRRAFQLKDELKAVVEVQITHYSPFTHRIWEVIGNCSVVLATRLHAGIFSCFASTPFIQIEYHEKCGDFLDDIGYKEKFRVGDMENSVSETVGQIIKILEGDKVFTVPLNKLQDKALKGFTCTKDYL